MENLILNGTLFMGVFIVLTILLFSLSKRFTSVPYTVALLVAGYYTQWVVKYFNLELPVELDSAVIYHILLPILLFESAFNINIHQFKIQFKTVSFLATIGLLISVFVVAFTLSYAIGLPFEAALLFGAVISATDPIAVIALFKNLGGPKRLALVADGESMFNDATGVIAYKVVAAFVVGTQAFNPNDLVGTTGEFLYVFFGSMILGAIVGYLVSYVFKPLREEKLMLTMLTVAFSLIVFNAAELFFHLSGVISIVAAAITLGNFGKPKAHGHAIHFMAEFWENLGFFSISLVFFFATYSLDISIFKQVPYLSIVAAIASVLLARAVSIYVGFFITNKVPFFNDEPNIPLSWQHILNWGGLRGVIPLVLVYSIPHTFRFYNEILAFTFASLLFTLLVNGLTIKVLLLKLKLHLPQEEENVIKEETNIFTLEESRKMLKKLPLGEFVPKALDQVEEELKENEKEHRAVFNEYLSNTPLMIRSFKIQSLDLQREVARELHEAGYINEAVIMEFESELDLQQDAIEYPEVFDRKVVDKSGKIKSRISFRKLIHRMNETSQALPFLKRFIRVQQKDTIVNRYMLLLTRLLVSDDVLWYVNYVKQFVDKNKEVLQGLDAIAEQHKVFVEDNKKQIEDITKEYEELILKHQKKVIFNLIYQGERHVHY